LSPPDHPSTPTLTNVTVPVEVPERRPGVPPRAMGPGPRIQPDPVPKLEHEPGLARSAQPRLGTAGHRVDHHQVSHRRQHPRLVPGSKPECLTGAVHLQRQGDKQHRITDEGPRGQIRPRLHQRTQPADHNLHLVAASVDAWEATPTPTANHQTSLAPTALTASAPSAPPSKVSRASAPGALLPTPVDASRLVIRATRERGVGVPSQSELGDGIS